MPLISSLYQNHLNQASVSAAALAGVSVQVLQSETKSWEQVPEPGRTSRATNVRAIDCLNNRGSGKLKFMVLSDDIYCKVG